MGEALDRLFQQWHRLGGAVLVAAADATVPDCTQEELIAESTARCRESGRLTWVVLDWLGRHIGELDEERLLRSAGERGDLAVLGVLCEAACERNPDAKLHRLMSACRPHPEPVIFFHRVAGSPLASRLAREGALELFRRWNFFCAELRYL